MTVLGQYTISMKIYFLNMKIEILSGLKSFKGGGLKANVYIVLRILDISKFLLCEELLVH